MKIGIVLATDELPQAAAIALAAVGARHEVVMFAMDTGCTALAEDTETARRLLDADVEITVCSNSAVGLPLLEGIVRGSQDDHAAVVGTCDRLVALT